MRNRTDCFQSDLMYKVSSAFALTRCSITHTRRYHTRGGVPTHPSRSVCSIGTAHNRLSTSHHSEIHKSVQLLAICKSQDAGSPHKCRHIMPKPNSPNAAQSHDSKMESRDRIHRFEAEIWRKLQKPRSVSAFSNYLRINIFRVAVKSPAVRV